MSTLLPVWRCHLPHLPPAAHVSPHYFPQTSDRPSSPRLGSPVFCVAASASRSNCAFFILYSQSQPSMFSPLSLPHGYVNVVASDSSRALLPP
ncbi:hypothetical protein B296_00054560 [Ensete ventricosum]|uniref:Uncharacterized protein n=1 Tax=Ensete ventricosum TaxID=4639 RepID=A0A426XWN8_ENSVE|nr:hypothetical protein B296_00054560 [Ensete ventricosum]